MNFTLKKPDKPAKAAITAPTDRTIRFERIFNAPRAKVWRALTEPGLLVQWWGRGGKYAMTIEQLDLKRGGHWRFVLATPGGPQGFEGRFREVKAPERLVQTLEWDGMPGHVGIETITLEDLGDGRTRYLCTSLFHTTEERDGAMQGGMEEGTHESFEGLDRVLEALA